MDVAAADAEARRKTATGLVLLLLLLWRRVVLLVVMVNEGSSSAAGSSSSSSSKILSERVESGEDENGKLEKEDLLPDFIFLFRCCTSTSVLRT